MVADKIEEAIKEAIQKTLGDQKEQLIPNNVEFIETDSLGETVEKLAILHIRTWMLEDAIQQASTNYEIADLKKKIDICFKVKRPKYVAAINAMIDNSIKTGRSLQEESVKLYKGVDNE